MRSSVSRVVKREKTVIPIFLVLFMIISLMVNSEAVYAEQSNGLGGTKNFDIVFVIDDSGSMQKTDPNKLTLQAIKAFFATRPDVGDQLGVVSYSLEEIDRFNLREIRSETDRDEINNFVDTRIKRNGDYTNIGAGLESAISQLDEFGVPNHSKAIILLTDGQNDVAKSSVSADEAEKRLDDSIKAAAAKNYPIYSIGLNPTDDTYKNCIDTIASETNGKSYFPNTPEDLTTNISGILKELNGQDGSEKGQDVNLPGNGQAVDVPIQIDDNVFEADIKIDHDDNIEFGVKKPDGKDAIDGIDYKTLSNGNSLTIKLLQPEAGDWTVSVSSDIKQLVHVDVLIYYQNLEVKFKDGQPDTTETNTSFSVSGAVYYIDDGSIIDDLEAYSDIDAELVIWDDKGNEVGKSQMDINQAEIHTDYQFTDKGNYTLGIKLTTKGNVIQSTDANKLNVTVSENKGGSSKPGPTPPQPVKKDNILIIVICAVLALAVIVGTLILLINTIFKGPIPGTMELLITTSDGMTESIPVAPPRGSSNDLFALIRNTINQAMVSERIDKIKNSINSNPIIKSEIAGKKLIIVKEDKMDKYMIRGNHQRDVIENGFPGTVFDSSLLDVESGFITTIMLSFTYANDFSDEDFA